MMPPSNATPQPLASLIVVAYHQKEYIRAAIESAFAQTYQPLEIILSDDGSTDGTFEIMQECAEAYEGPHQVVLRPRSSNLGLAPHLNEVVALAKGAFISWLAGDDIAAPERMEAFVRPMLDDETVMATHSAVEEIDEAGNLLRLRVRSEGERALSLGFVCEKGTGLVAQSCCFRHALWDRFGPFAADLSNEGPVMGFRAAALGRVVYIDEPLTRYRIGTGVSTYAGRDVQRLKQTEPIKIAHWRMSAFTHMLADAQKLQAPLSADVMRALQNNADYARALYAINKGEKPLLNLVRALRARPSDMRALRALARRAAPLSLYRRLCK